MWELDYKKSWAQNNWCFWTVVLEKTFESPLTCKETKPVNPKGNQSWVFIGRMNAEAETPVLWPPDVKNWLIGKNPDAGKDWKQGVKGTTEDGWLDGITNSMDMSLKQTLGDGEGQGRLACCSPWGHKKSDTTERLNNNKLKKGNGVAIIHSGKAQVGLIWRSREWRVNLGHI